MSTYLDNETSPDHADLTQALSLWTTAEPAGLSAAALRRACRFMEANLGDSLTLDDLAGAAGVSRFHFARLFRVSTGSSPMNYLMQQRIARSQLLLLRRDRSICDIAAALGFCDQSHFSRTFRRMTGQTPREFVRSR
jgi:transcriptional regulator GlxA family with amidase domain